MISERVFLEAGALRAMVAESGKRGHKFIREFRSRAALLMADLDISERVLIDAIQHCASGYPLSNDGIRRHSSLIARILLERSREALRTTVIGMRCTITFWNKEPPLKGIVLVQSGDAMLIATKIDRRRATAMRQVVSAAHPNIRSIRIY